MTRSNRYKSDAFEAIHSSASALYKIGAIDKATLRSFDDSCLTVPQKFAPDEIKALRIDPSNVYRVAPSNHIQLRRGDAVFSFEEGAFAFFSPLDGQITGERRQATERAGAEIAGCGREARAESVAVAAFHAPENIDGYRRIRDAARAIGG